jgi:hypothetical protein
MTQFRLHTNIKWVPHPAPAYNRCLETFMCCCGWAYGAINHQAAIVTCVGPHWGSLVSWNPGVHCWATNDTMVQWLWHWPRSHIFSLHIRCLTIFIWCGWAYGTIPSLVHYIFMCRPRLGKSAEIQCPCWASHNTIMQWLRLYTSIKWFPHPIPPYKKVFGNLYMLWMGTSQVLPHWSHIWHLHTK